jgi:hypothetical protein
MLVPQSPKPEHLLKIQQADAEWARGLDSDERFSIYRGLFDLIANVRNKTLPQAAREAGELLAWQEKLAARNRWIKVFPEYGRQQR